MKDAPETLLLAEDDDDDYLIFSLALRETKLAAELSRVANGDELMESLEESIPDVLFLDIRIPCRNGTECLKEIRANARFDEMPVVIHSGFGDDKNIGDCYEAGATRYVIKPNTIREVAEILQNLLVDNWKNSLSRPDKGSFLVNPPDSDRR